MVCYFLSNNVHLNRKLTIAETLLATSLAVSRPLMLVDSRMSNAASRDISANFLERKYFILILLGITLVKKKKDID